MIVVLEHGIKDRDKQDIVSFLEGRGFRVREIQGEEETVLGAVGIVPIDVREVELLAGVARVIPITSRTRWPPGSSGRRTRPSPWGRSRSAVRGSS